ncbi:MAG: sigma 54-interacting transcriptional regulator [Acidobacteriota bacterium]
MTTPSRVAGMIPDLLHRVAAAEAHVLIVGEAGTGKRQVARTVHALSRRRGHPFVNVDCAAFSVSLLESSLFGRGERAAIPSRGAGGGLLQAAHGGTLFLAQFEHVPERLQERLLSFLEDLPRPESPDPAGRPARVRLVASTRMDPRREPAAGRFGMDLSRRFHWLLLPVPPLRERPEEIPALVQSFLKELTRKIPGAPCAVLPGAMDRLCRHAWPGNIRELRDTVERMAMLSRTPFLGLEDLPAAFTRHAPPHPGPAPPGLSFREAKQRVVRQFERQYLHDLLAAHAGHVTSSAQHSGMNRSALQRLMRKHHLCSNLYRTALAETRT